MSKPPTFPHPSWTNNTFEIDEDIEDIGSYGPGGFHPVVLGDIFNDRYTVVHKLGSGGISTVWLVWDQSESQYVSLKIMRADQLETSKELRIHRHLTQLKINLEDNFICPLYDDFLHEGPNGTHICLVFPLAGDCVAEDIDLSLPHTREERTEQARRYGRQLAHAVALLHSVGIVHGDLSRANVLTQVSSRHYASLDELYKDTGEPEKVERIRQTNLYEPGTLHLVSSADLSKFPRTGKVLLVDFGDAFLIDYPPTRGLGITVAYAAPEDLYAKAASSAADLWAMGCLFFDWWCGQPLFQGYDQESISSEWTILLGKLPQLYWDQYKGRKKLFNDQGSLLPGKNSHLVSDDVTDLAHLVNQSWKGIRLYTRETSKVSTEFMPWHPHHWPTPPQISVSVIRDMTRDHCIVTRITPNLSCSISTTSLGNQSDHLKSDDNNLNVKVENSTLNASLSTLRPKSVGPSLSRCAPARPPIQLPSGAVDFYCLLKQLLAYDPNQRLPALMILRHHWFSDSPKQCETQAPAATQESTFLASAGNEANKADMSELGVSVYARWSLALDERSQRWEYLRRIGELTEDSGGN